MYLFEIRLWFDDKTKRKNITMMKNKDDKTKMKNKEEKHF